MAQEHPFAARRGQWGALRVVGRDATLNSDNAAFPVFANPAVSASEAQAWAARLDWYLNRNLIVKVSFSRTTFCGGGASVATPPGSVTHQPEEVVFTRLQPAF